MGSLGFQADLVISLSEGYDALTSFGAKHNYDAFRATQPHLHELAQKLAAGTAQLVDVREPNEMALGMCGAATAFPLSEMRE